MEIKNPVSGNNDLESPLEVRQSSSLHYRVIVSQSGDSGRSADQKLVSLDQELQSYLQDYFHNAFIIIFFHKWFLILCRSFLSGLYVRLKDPLTREIELNEPGLKYFIAKSFVIV